MMRKITIAAAFLVSASSAFSAGVDRVGRDTRDGVDRLDSAQGQRLHSARATSARINGKAALMTIEEIGSKGSPETQALAAKIRQIAETDLIDSRGMERLMNAANRVDSRLSADEAMKQIVREAFGDEGVAKDIEGCKL